QGVDDHLFDGAILIDRAPSGRLDTRVQLGETMGNDSLTNLTVGMFGVAILDFMAQNPQGGFQLPTPHVVRSLRPGAGPSEPSAYASRLIVGMVFGVLIFITIVIYGMWVAAGVVAEKSSRVMELLISAASARQLVLGKAIGIGLAGATQYVLVLVPA